MFSDISYSLQVLFRVLYLSLPRVTRFLCTSLENCSINGLEARKPSCQWAAVKNKSAKTKKKKRDLTATQEKINV